MTGAVSAGVRLPGLMVEPDCVVVRAGEGEAGMETNLLLQLTSSLHHHIARLTVAAWLVSAVTGEV